MVWSSPRSVISTEAKLEDATTGGLGSQPVWCEPAHVGKSLLMVGTRERERIVLC